MKKAKEKTCQGCNGQYTMSTASNEDNFCSQLCENGKYAYTLKKLKG